MLRYCSQIWSSSSEVLRFRSDRRRRDSAAAPITSSPVVKCREYSAATSIEYSCTMHSSQPRGLPRYLDHPIYQLPNVLSPPAVKCSQYRLSDLSAGFNVDCHSSHQSNVKHCRGRETIEQTQVEKIMAWRTSPTSEPPLRHHSSPTHGKGSRPLTPQKLPQLRPDNS